MGSFTRADRIAALLVVVLGALIVVVGVRTGDREVDVDELVYRRTLVSMRAGEGYYPAMRAALVRKEGAPPSQLRSVRPPTMFVLLCPFPPSTWRWVVGAVYLAVLILVWRLSRPLAQWAGPVGVTVAALWLMGASPLLFLHSELWGLPFLLGGALAQRRQQWALAAALLVAAVAFREIYVVALAAGLITAERRRPFVIAAGILAGLLALHVVLAQDVLSPSGRENALRNGTLGAEFILNAVSPLNGPLGWCAGLPAMVLGGAGIVRRWTVDQAARILGVTAVILVPAAILVGREYWSLTYGVGVAAFVPAGVVALSSRAGPVRAGRG